MEDLLELIEKDQETISNYLEDVSVEQFIEDVKTLLRNSSDKVIIEQAIKRLQSLL
jgi:hypothetical protein